MLHTTLKLCREKGACVTGFKKLKESLGKGHSDTDLIPLTRVLKANGLHDAIWALRATVEDSDYLAREFAIFCARQVLPLYEDKYPNDSKVRDCIDATERYNNKEITLEELAVFRTAAYWAASATRSAAATSAVSAAYTVAAEASSSAAEAAEAAEYAPYWSAIAVNVPWAASAAAEAAAARNNHTVKLTELLNKHGALDMKKIEVDYMTGKITVTDLKHLNTTSRTGSSTGSIVMYDEEGAFKFIAYDELDIPSGKIGEYPGKLGNEDSRGILTNSIITLDSSKVRGHIQTLISEARKFTILISKEVCSIMDQIDSEMELYGITEGAEGSEGSDIVVGSMVRLSINVINVTLSAGAILVREIEEKYGYLKVDDVILNSTGDKAESVRLEGASMYFNAERFELI